jgi:hypothetical protein
MMGAFDSYIIDQQEKVMRDKRLMDITTWTPEEIKIRELTIEIEKLGAHPMLTDVICKLSDARTLLTNYYIEVVGDAPDKEQQND